MVNLHPGVSPVYDPKTTGAHRQIGRDCLFPFHGRDKHIQTLTLGVLEFLTGFGLAVFLSLDLASVACKKAALAEHPLKILVHHYQCTSHGQANGAGLPGEPTAAGHATHINLAQHFSSFQRTLGMIHKSFARKISAYLAAVYHKLALTGL